MKTHLISLLCLMGLSCTSNPYEKEAWKVAERSEKNSKELTVFLKHYQESGNKEKYAAACFLVSNLPGKHSMSPDQKRTDDIDIVRSDSLIRSLEYSFDLRKNSPFLKFYNSEQFFEYILPHRVADEPLEYGWKWDLKARLNLHTEDIKAAAEEINAQIKLEMSAENYGNLPQSYSSMIKNGYGKCDVWPGRMPMCRKGWTTWLKLMTSAGKRLKPMRN